MLESRIELKNGLPTLFIDNSAVTQMAYTTYFPERSCHADFAAAGYRIFFVNLSFTRLSINTDTGFSPFRVGIFDKEGSEDYSEFEENVSRILAECPDAIIFPRIYISMPKWWVDSHPCDVIATPKGEYREEMFSEAFRADGEKLLARIINHIKKAPYSERVGGWMICAAWTQEWFYRSHDGGLGEPAREPYRRFMLENYGIDGAEIPDKSEYDYKGEAKQSSENAKRYSEFCNLAMAESLDFFAGVVKRETDFRQVVGAFYGYTYEIMTPTAGTYALRRVIDSPNLDYFSSPNSYINNRSFGMDWADMIPVDSLKHHGKLAFIECDIRTYLTTSIQNARPGEYPDDIYTVNGVSLWVGPPTAELSLYAIRKSFAHQITKGSAIWWFDMWGGWFAGPTLMKEIAEMKKIYDTGLAAREDMPSAEVVYFADEESYANVFSNSPQITGTYTSRIAIGRSGVPYDTCAVRDAEQVLGKYKAAIFPFPIPSEAGERAMKLCERMGIPYIRATAEHCELSLEEIRDFIEKSGVNLYAPMGEVVYAGCGYVGLHSASGGKKKLKLPKKMKIKAVFGADINDTVADSVSFELLENATALFKVDTDATNNTKSK